jgi:hypothetical protein
MSICRVNLLVEGQTEENFVNELLVPHFAERNIFLFPRMVETGRTIQKERRNRRGISGEIVRIEKIHRGGLLSYSTVKEDIEQWLSQDDSAYLTTMLDLYALPGDFPGRVDAAQKNNPVERVRFLESSLASDIGNPRFIPHIQLHEFEALLFSNIETLDQTILNYVRSVSRIDELREIRAILAPEEINEGELTAPSKRLLALYGEREYDKVTLGVMIAIEIGLETMRRECPHFAEWLATLESLPRNSAS